MIGEYLLSVVNDTEESTENHTYSVSPRIQSQIRKAFKYRDRGLSGPGSWTKRKPWSIGLSIQELGTLSLEDVFFHILWNSVVYSYR